MMWTVLHPDDVDAGLMRTRTYCTPDHPELVELHRPELRELVEYYGLEHIGAGEVTDAQLDQVGITCRILGLSYRSVILAAAQLHAATTDPAEISIPGVDRRIEGP